MSTIQRQAIQVVSFIFLLSIATIAHGQVLAERAPADPAIYIGWAGINEHTPGYAGSHLESLLSSSNLPTLINKVIPQALDRIAEMEPQAKEPIAIVRSLLGPMYRHPSALTIVGVDLANGPRPLITLVCQAGNEAAAFKQQIDQLLAQAGQTPFPVHVVQKDDLVAVIVGYDKPEDGLIQPGPEAKSLANDPLFIKSLAQVDKSAFLTAYVSGRKILSLAELGVGMADPGIQQNWGKIRDQLGLRGLESAILTAGFDGKDWSTRGFVSAPAPRSGFVGSFIDAPPLSDDILKSIPQNAAVAGASRFDLAGFVGTIRNAISQFDANSAKQLDQGLEQLNQMAGVDVEKDFLGSLGAEWAYYNDPSVAGNGIVGTTLVNRLSDPTKFEATASKIEEKLNEFVANQIKEPNVHIKFKHVKFGNVTVHYLATPLVSPSWAVNNGNLYVALYPETVAAAAFFSPGKYPSILQNASFIALHKRAGGAAPQSFAFEDLPRLAPEMYSTWLAVSHVAQIADVLGLSAPVGLLPPLPTLMHHIEPAAQFSWADKDGWHFRGTTPFPGAEALASDPFSGGGIGSAAVMTSVLLPALNKVRGEAQAAKSSANLRMIGSAAIIFANQHNGKFPPTIGYLLDTNAVVAQTFINPSSNTSLPSLPPDDLRRWLNHNSDYVWNGAGKSVDSPVDTPIAWERLDRTTGQVNILFADLHVERFPVDRAAEIINKATPK